MVPIPKAIYPLKTSENQRFCDAFGGDTEMEHWCEMGQRYYAIQNND